MISEDTILEESLDCELNEEAEIIYHKSNEIIENQLQDASTVDVILAENANNKPDTNVIKVESSTTEYFNMSEETRDDNQDNSYRDMVENCLRLFKEDNNKIKYLEFLNYKKHIIDADHAISFVKANEDTMTDDDIAEHCVIIQQGVNTRDVLDRIMREAKREMKMEKKLRKKHRNR